MALVKLRYKSSLYAVFGGCVAISTAQGEEKTALSRLRWKSSLCAVFGGRVAILTAQGEENKAQKHRAGRSNTIEDINTVHSDVSRGVWPF
jgi:hypothetical protein